MLERTIARRGGIEIAAEQKSQPQPVASGE
jgi:hypothetical protein